MADFVREELMMALGNAITEMEENPDREIVNKALESWIAWAGERVLKVSVQVEVCDEVSLTIYDDDEATTPWPLEMPMTPVEMAHGEFMGLLEKARNEERGRLIEYHRERAKREKRLVEMEDDRGGRRAAWIRYKVHRQAVEWLEGES
jgi:hypothetical protein